MYSLTKRTVARCSTGRKLIGVTSGGVLSELLIIGIGDYRRQVLEMDRFASRPRDAAEGRTGG